MDSVRVMPDADFSLYAEAVARENEIRGAACLGINEIICGLEVKPLCAAHVRLLSVVRSPFLGRYPVAALCEKPDIVTDIMRFLWIASPMYEAGSRASAAPPPRRRFEFEKNYRARCAAALTPRDTFNVTFAPILKLPVGQVVSEILQFVDEAYTDAEEGTREQTSYYAFEASIAHELATTYPASFRIDFWNSNCPREKNPLLAPLKLVFQLRKLRAIIAHGTKVVSNKSDRELVKGLEAMAARDKMEHAAKGHEN
jgi:hypothetical protein